MQDGCSTDRKVTASNLSTPFSLLSFSCRNDNKNPKPSHLPFFHESYAHFERLFVENDRWMKEHWKKERREKICTNVLLEKWTKVINKEPIYLENKEKTTTIRTLNQGLETDNGVFQVCIRYAFAWPKMKPKRLTTLTWT